jgi:hypothetical protein
MKTLIVDGSHVLSIQEIPIPVWTWTGAKRRTTGPLILYNGRQKKRKGMPMPRSWHGSTWGVGP